MSKAATNTLKEKRVTSTYQAAVLEQDAMLKRIEVDGLY